MTEKGKLFMVIFLFLDFIYCLLCFISGILIFFSKKQGFNLYQISDFIILFICTAIFYITEMSNDLIFEIIFIPVILWVILNSFVKKNITIDNLKK